ncbi:cadherin-like domain-containing protein [Hymenobacter weizhouensis]|uniref:cadherin-like domain-containing protein n=1 Tax=Hymenobacter sp. YIM 151500-1 TaxID=2987689 RepID=UPI0022261F31|nr:cadherin-like domain-containing protein [Hymenobacter sp. YIM 151500-1]UYZ62145.1 cadherin-like domain-containing protein [Hymenobacter sp. YIM 151500-1]
MTRTILSHIGLFLLLLLGAGSAWGQNLIANPGFEAGNTDFTSAYQYVAPPGTDPGAGHYTVGKDNRAFNANFQASYPDHTFGNGTGNYLIVNAATTALTVWEQTVTGLQANSTYQFSFWLLNTFPVSKARLQVSANGVDVGPVFSNPNDGGNWQQNTVSISTGAGTQLTIRLRNLNLDGNGNDFGLDDMALVAAGVNSQLTANNVTTASVSTAAAISGAQISPLSASIAGPSGATVASFTVVTLPTVGSLRVGSSSGPLVAAGQVISAAQAGQLYYTPAGSTTQNVTFTYSATDSNGSLSANTATYTIPVVAAGPPPGCGPAYGGGPSASGLSADYYPGYFADNLSFFSTTASGLSRIDPQLNFVSSTTTAADGWGNIIPPATPNGGNPADPELFSSRHRGSIYIATAGAYTFTLSSDDASYLWLDGAALAPTIANATINNGGAHGTRPVSATVTLSAGLHNILVYYGENGGGNTLVLEYSSTAGAGFSTRVVPNSVLCAGPSALPPVATNVTNSPAMPSSNGATAIQPLAGTDPNPGGSVTSYRIASLPSAASGVLYLGLGAVPVTVGQTLTAAEAADLSFDPDPIFTGNATFTFFAINNAGIASNEPATYTIPVVGPVADVTTTLAGPATLGAGLSSGTFTVTFSNNGPQSAAQVTQTVRLPTGATMSAAQQAALPASASYSSATNTINFGTVPVLASGTTNTFTFSFTSPTTQGANSLISTVGAGTSQGTNAAPDQATLSVTVTAGNFFVTSDDSNEVPGNSAKSGNVILNDNNPANLANSGFEVQVVTNPTNGTLVLNANGSYTYTPTNGYLGPDAFTYRVRVPGSSPEFSNVSTVALNVYDAALVCTIGTGTNLLQNPSFTAGNTGFTSTYTYVTQTGNGLVPEATYTVAANAASYHPDFAGTGRNGAGDNFMIVNGSQDLSVVYQQTITVRPNTYYNFAAFANSVNPGSPAQLGFVINGKSTSSVTTLDGTTNYTRIADLWFSGSNTSAVIEIRDVNKVRGGNDFGLDDLYIGTCTIGLTANNVTAPGMSNVAPSSSVPSLSATVTAGPAVGSFTVQTLPSSTAGVLYLGTTPVVPGQVIPVNQAGNLFFDPVAGFVGNAVFTYSATDESGAGSNNTATYTIPVDNRPLPVTLVAFEAKAAGRNARLTWRTAQELHNDRFEVERSTNGQDFTTIAHVAGRGTHAGFTDYQHLDVNVAQQASTVYYRLRQVDHDGTATYSSVQVVRFEDTTPKTPTVVVYPNPATATVSLDLQQLPAGTYQVSLHDAVGRLVLETRYAGGDTHPLDVHSLINGTYVLQVRGANGLQFVKRLVKQ